TVGWFREVPGCTAASGIQGAVPPCQPRRSCSAHRARSESESSSPNVHDSPQVSASPRLAPAVAAPTPLDSLTMSLDDEARGWAGDELRAREANGLNGKVARVGKAIPALLVL